jgi:periplasmic protein CpxP/Spy
MDKARLHFQSSTSNGTLAFRLLTILIVCLVLEGALISCSSNIPNRRETPETRRVKPAEHILLEMEIDLNLSKEQAEKVRPIIEGQVKKRKELIRKFQDQGQAGLRALEAELKALRINTEKELQYYLTNEQMIKYGNMQQEEDRRIISQKPKEQDGPQMPQGRGSRPGGS